MSQTPDPDESRRLELDLVVRYRDAFDRGEPPSPELVAELDELFARHQDRVYRACLRFVGQPEKARELAQDTLLTAYQKLPEFRGECAFSSWLFGIARFLCFNAVRRRGELLLDDDVLSAADPRSTALTRLRQGERERLLQDALSTLDPQEQEAVHLRYVELIPQEQITAILAIDDKSGARGLLQRCRRKLRRELYRRLEAMGHGSSFIREVPG